MIGYVDTNLELRSEMLPEVRGMYKFQGLGSSYLVTGYADSRFFVYDTKLQHTETTWKFSEEPFDSLYVTHHDNTLIYQTYTEGDASVVFFDVVTQRETMRIGGVKSTDTPVVINNMIYLRIKEGQSYYLNAYDMYTSDLVWSHEVGKYYDEYTIDDRVTILCPYNGHCYQLDASTGAIIKPEWTVPGSRAKALVGTLGRHIVMHTWHY
jgi:outer membrane protein assembly factor BamB